MKELGRFDPDLQMFVVSKPADSDMNHLRDLRRRAEKGEFGPKPLSIPRGENLFRLSNVEIKKYAMIQAEAELKPSIGARRAAALEDHIAHNGDY